MNKVLIVHGDDSQPLLVNSEMVTKEENIKVASIDAYTLASCAALMSVAYAPRYAIDAFAFQETITQMQQHYESQKSDAEDKRRCDEEAECQ